MKKTIFCLLFIFLSTHILYSQNEEPNSLEYSHCVTVGVLQGGGSLVGADVEFAISRRLSFQIGGGFVGFGGGINYHFKPTLRSSFISVQYWNQGTRKSFSFNGIGTSFVYRGKKFLTGQLGFCFPISYGPGWNDKYRKTPILLIYSIGVYFPF